MVSSFLAQIVLELYLFSAFFFRLVVWYY